MICFTWSQHEEAAETRFKWHRNRESCALTWVGLNKASAQRNVKHTGRRCCFHSIIWLKPAGRMSGAILCWLGAMSAQSQESAAMRCCQQQSRAPASKRPPVTKKFTVWLKLVRTEPSNVLDLWLTFYFGAVVHKMLLLEPSFALWWSSQIVSSC